MFKRIAQSTLASHLTWSPAVAILGPRQIGKTTLARALLDTHPNAIYLDLESPQDQARLGEGPLFLQAHADRLVILDEVHERDLESDLLFGMLGTRAMALVRLARYDEAAEWGLKAATRPNAHVHIQAIAAHCLALAGRVESSSTRAP